MLRFAVVLSVVGAATPSLAAEVMTADAARHFVANRQVSFTCFEGSVGSGRIGADGSVAGVIRIRGAAPTRFIHLPPGTLFSKGETVCSYVKGAFFNPCFNLEKTGVNSFRGAVSGFGFAYCDFVRRNVGSHELVASASPLDDKLPMPTQRSIRRGAKVKHGGSDDVTASTASARSHTPAAAPAAPPAAASAPAAAPTTPVTTAPLPPSLGETGMRGSVSQ